MKDIYITWEDYHNKIEQLAKKVHEDKLKFNQIKVKGKCFIFLFIKIMINTIRYYLFHSS